MPEFVPAAGADGLDTCDVPQPESNVAVTQTLNA